MAKKTLKRKRKVRKMTKREINRTINKLINETARYHTSRELYSPEFKWSETVIRRLKNIPTPPAQLKKSTSK